MDDLIGTAAVPGCKEMPRRGALLEISADGRPLEGDPGLVQRKTRQGGSSTEGIHHDRGLYGKLPITLLKADVHPVGIALNLMKPRAAKDLNASAAKALRHGLGDIVVASGEKLGIALEDRHPGSECLEIVRHLECDRAASEHHGRGRDHG